MKGNYPKQVYIIMTVLGIGLLVLNTVMDLPIAAGVLLHMGGVF